ncbi:MAG TPA: GNAT family N-acetyltransferase [Gemmatimonadaceae bacterium]|nr:GNAT family N-acetyltransferase [Gemmatimonadaceae bacterium]
MHKIPTVAVPLRGRSKQRASAPELVRRATRADAGQILELVSPYAAQGLMLPRNLDQIASRIDNYVVATDGTGRVLACAALEEYSPSLAEVSSVAVAPSQHGKGLGTQVVLGVERLARARDIDEVFALSLTDNFFLSLGYKPCTVSRYPEKLARYDVLTKEGVEIVPKRCFQKTLDKTWSAPRLVETEVTTKLRRIAGC